MRFYSALAAFDAWLDERREKRGQGLAAAVGSWCGALGHGLWDFLRGADLRSAEAAAPSNGAKVSSPSAKVEADAELFAEEDEEDDPIESDDGDDCIHHSAWTLVEDD